MKNINIVAILCGVGTYIIWIFLTYIVSFGYTFLILMRSVNDFSLVTVKNIVSFTLVFDSIGTIITGFVTGYISKVNKIKNTLVLTGVIAILDGGFRIYKNAITYTSLVFLFLNLAFCFVGGYIAYLITKNKENPQIAEN